MVNIIENWAKLKGKVVSVIPNEKLEAYSVMLFKLEKSDDVENFPNLADADTGKSIKVNVKTSELEKRKIEPGAELSFTARKAFDQFYFIK